MGDDVEINYEDIKIVTKMLKMGITVEEIAMLIELPVKSIIELQRKV